MKIKVGLEKNDMYSLLRTKISPTGMFEDDFSFPVDILLVPWYWIRVILPTQQVDLMILTVFLEVELQG